MANTWQVSLIDIVQFVAKERKEKGSQSSHYKWGFNDPRQPILAPNNARSG
jgi:hypothetical protein